MPLANVTARNIYKAGKVGKEIVLLQLTEKQQNIITEVDNAVQTVRSSYQQIVASRKAREFAEQALAAQNKQLSVGTVTPYIVQQYQERLTAARTAELLALSDFNKAKAQLTFSEGATLEAHKVALKLH
jgi:outer membrane protein TolC